MVLVLVLMILTLVLEVLTALALILMILSQSYLISTDGFWGYLQSKKKGVTHWLNNIGLRDASASKNTKAHRVAAGGNDAMLIWHHHADYQWSRSELLMHFPFLWFLLQFFTYNLASLRFVRLTICSLTQKRCRRSLPLRGFLQCHARPLPPQTTESKGRKEAAQVHYDRVAIAGVHMTN